jgi:predicted transcriptional regulator
VIYTRTDYYISNSMPETADPREAIRDCVSENPGIHFNELVRSVGMATGQVQYHMYRLTEGGGIDGASLYGRTHYYPSEYPEDKRGAVALLRRETAREVVVYLIENGESGPEEVAEALGVARSTVEWHLGRLEEQGLVEKRRGGDGRVTVSAVDEERTVGMLSDISPSLADTLVDRFVTMVDRMLEETE